MNTPTAASRNRRTLAAAAVITASALLLSGCSNATGAASASGSKERKLTLVAYSVPQKAYKIIIPAFQEYWKDKTGETVEFTESYGGSGVQARAVIDGLDADVVQLAMEPDVEKIAEAGLIEPGWRDRAKNKAVPTTSLVVLGVRPGNPKGIADWADIAKPGVGVITPDPKTSGGAKWNVLAAYGALSLAGSEQQAYQQTLGVFRNALVLDKSARDASNTFLKKGLGDAAVLWESDANIAKAEGGEFDVVLPKSTILAETSVAVVDKTVDADGNREVAQAFVDFLYTPEAQKAFAETGLRPVDQTILAQYADRYPTPAGRLFTVDDLGGWKDAGERFFGRAGVYSRIEAEAAKR